MSKINQISAAAALVQASASESQNRILRFIQDVATCPMVTNLPPLLYHDKLYRLLQMSPSEAAAAAEYSLDRYQRLQSRITIPIGG